MFKKIFRFFFPKNMDESITKGQVLARETHKSIANKVISDKVKKGYEAAASSKNPVDRTLAKIFRWSLKLVIGDVKTKE